MYLKSINIYGFKSFAQKIIFKFDKGITGIVGPNGSGKSNIADAVRWVLGEQSVKILRGNSMQDVIFAGTETRKPLGYCQVDLTIDNEDMMMPIDYTEVTVSRRVYRSGESEYYINGSACRLKDIHELFMDTGVGKEGYSIIGQGQIDKILSTKPDDRRGLFDEAAGIVKFKKRKISAEKKLEEEKQNLLRVNDIIRELESRKESLYEQSKKAKEYLSYREQLKKYEVNIYINENEKIDAEIAEIEHKEKIIDNQVLNLKNEVKQINTKHEKLNENIEELENKINSQKQLNTDIAIQKQKSQSNIQIAKEQIINLRKNNERINIQTKELKEKHEKNINQKNEYLEVLNNLKKQNENKEDVLIKKEEELKGLNNIISQEEKAIEEIQTNRIQKLNEISSVKSKIQRYETIIENNSSRKKVIESRKQIIEKTIESLNKEVDVYTEELENLKKKEIQHNKEKELLKNAIKLREINLKEKNSQLLKKNEQIHTAKSKYNALKGINEQYEGYGFSIKKIMEYKKQNNVDKIIGVVADIISVDKKYETAIEIALGGNVQNIVTADEETAKAMIEYLKYNRFGRGTFLPLSSIRGKGKYSNVKTNEKGFVGYASDLVKCEKQFKNIVDYLLGRVIVVDNIDNAVNLAKKYNYTIRIVTLAGEVINPGGSLTGGAYKNKGNQFLSRKRELEQYENNITTWNKELNIIKQEYNNLENEIITYKEKLEALINNEHKISLDINSTHLMIKQLENDISKHQTEISDIQIELKQLSKQEVELKEAIDDLNKSLEGTQNEDEEAEKTVQKLTLNIQENKVKSDILSNELTSLKVESSKVKQELKNVTENLTRIELELEEIKKQIDKNNNEVHENLMKISEKEDLIVKLEEEILKLEEQRNKNESELESLEQERISKTKEQEKLYKLKEEKNNEISILEKDAYRLQNAKTKYEMELQNKRDYIWNEYELTIHKAYEYKDESLGSISDMKKNIDLLKRKIKSLGEVHVSAIEEYKSVNERYTFLTEQRDDLVEAEQKLRKIIDELNEQMKKQFKQKFSEITVKFNEVFNELFGGGKAMLELTDGEDILEAGIEIIAQPPGKKLQNMRLLSGGERAFTAIALLFAIQSLRPSPFCVLDEIEAALDDANVYRFANYLQKLTTNTQFIIITHRRGTMEVADALYGITMQEKGVSTQVSVKLIEDELED